MLFVACTPKFYMDNLETLFAQYEKCFAQLDFQGMGELFDDALVTTGPHGVIASGKDDFLNKANKAAAFYKEMGMKGAKILSRYELSISEQYSMVTIHWGVIFQKPKDRKVEFDASYIVEKIKRPKIIMMITHQDEKDMIEKLQVEIAEKNN